MRHTATGAGQCQKQKQPHWACPNAIGIFPALPAWSAIFRFTGVSDIFIAATTGAIEMAASATCLKFPQPARPKALGWDE
jgi:hypothetical protein